MSRYVLALDQGTTSSRALLFDRWGKVVAKTQREFAQMYPQPGLVEHDAMAIWATQLAVMGEVLAAAGAGPGDVAAVGITNQRETTVIWERATGRPIANAIVWQDRRTAPWCERLRAEGHEPLVMARTGLRLDPYFSATKVRWLLDHIAGAAAAAARGELAMGTIDSWLVWNLTGGAAHVTDASNASRTMLFDIHRGQWDDELLRLFGVPRSLLPEVVDSTGLALPIGQHLPAAGAPIAGIAGDQQAALFGQGCTQPGMAKNTYGTGCFLLLHTGTQAVTSRNRLLTTVAWRRRGVLEYALEGSVFTAGAVIQWLRDELQLVKTAQELDALAASVPDSAGVYLVPAFAGLGAPQWDPHARGAVFGLTRGSTRAHLCRAALEGIALQCEDLLDCMRKDSGLALRELRVDGGGARSDVLLQIQADLLGATVQRPLDVETTARGAALLAGESVGFFAPEVAAAVAGATFAPRALASAQDALRKGWRKALQRASGWAQD